VPCRGSSAVTSTAEEILSCLDESGLGSGAVTWGDQIQ